MTAPDLSPEDLLAAEYVLGLLEPEALLEARGRIAREPEFAAAVEWWQSRLAPLLDELGGADPGPELWPRIEAALTTGTTTDGTDVVTLRRRLRYWQAMAALAMAASLALLVFALLPLMRTPVAPTVTATPVPVAAPLVAEVPLGEGTPRLAVMWLPQPGELVVTAAGLTADGVHDHELWLLAGEGPPHSLGLVRAGGVSRVRLSPQIAALIRDGSKLAVSREPLGGKPPDGDLGPVVAQGAFTRT